MEGRWRRKKKRIRREGGSMAALSRWQGWWCGSQQIGQGDLIVDDLIWKACMKTKELKSARE